MQERPFQELYKSLKLSGLETIAVIASQNPGS